MLFMMCASPRCDGIVVPELEASLAELQAPAWRQAILYNCSLPIYGVHVAAAIHEVHSAGTWTARTALVCHDS